MIGAPLRTQFHRLSADFWALVSNRARMGSPRATLSFSASTRALPKASTSASSGLSRSMGTITTWRGAMAGGRRRPSSSPWVMITPPIIRVEVPQDEVWQNSSSPASL